MGSSRAVAEADRVASTTSYTDIEKENAERDGLLKKVEPRDLIQFGMIPVINNPFIIEINITYLIDLLMWVDYLSYLKIDFKCYLNFNISLKY